MMKFKNIRKFIIWVVFLFIISTVSTSVASIQGVDKDFDDVKKSDWFYDSVKEARKIGLIAGVGNNKYAPNRTITYAEFLTIIARVTDDNLDAVEGGLNWYDKYINSARGRGVLGKEEALEALMAIPRQDMIKFTCKALNIEPYTGNEIVFNDVKPEDAAWINAAYNEYLTEGVGRDKGGKKVFGYGQTATRAQLAAMALRIKEYKTDPVAYKEKKAIERKQADEAYKTLEQRKQEWIALGKNGGITSEEQLTPEVIKNIRALGYVYKDYDTGAPWGWWSEPTFYSVRRKISSDEIFRMSKESIIQAVKSGKVNTDDIQGMKNIKTMVISRDLFWDESNQRNYKGVYRVIVNGNQLWDAFVFFNVKDEVQCTNFLKKANNIFDEIHYSLIFK